MYNTYYMYLHTANNVTLTKVVFLFYTEIMISFKSSIEMFLPFLYPNY